MTDCEHTIDGECDRKQYLGEGVFDPSDYVTPCHTCPLDDLPVACAVCGENFVGPDDPPVCQSCSFDEWVDAVEAGIHDEAVVY